MEEDRPISTSAGSCSQPIPISQGKPHWRVGPTPAPSPEDQPVNPRPPNPKTLSRHLVSIITLGEGMRPHQLPGGIQNDLPSVLNGKLAL